ncbi:hypothetical protein EJ110_NYTH34622 [Nymphaea thermarum]|nr:hypothetical protein EJ110_NYTH34622 [Nymphaea thermarum]
MKGFLSALLSKPAASLRQLEHDVETVIKVLQPGPLGVVEHKFSAIEIRQAEAAVRSAIENWKRNTDLESRHGFVKHKEGGSSS